MSPTLIAEVSLEDVLDMLAYMAYIGTITEAQIIIGLGLLLSERRGWDLNDLAQQIMFRKEILSGNSTNLPKIRDVAMGLDRTTQSYQDTLQTARVIKTMMDPLAEPPINLADIPF